MVNKRPLANDKTDRNKLRAKRLTRRLESHPEMLDRFESILDLAENGEGVSFDEIEQCLFENVRCLGGKPWKAGLNVERRRWVKQLEPNRRGCSSAERN